MRYCLDQASKTLEYYYTDTALHFTGSTTAPAHEKQHNRGQDGAGVAAIKLDVKPGSQYIFR
jgi:amidophosphoribosyltransferase